MSSLRELRLLVARHLDQPPNVKRAVLDFLNVFDLTLDSEGFEDGELILHALKRLENALIDSDANELDSLDTDDTDLPPHTDALAIDWVTLDDLLDVEDEDDGN